MRYRNFTLILTFGLAVFFFSACETGQQRTEKPVEETETEKDTEALKTEYQQIQTQLDTTWQTMMEDDDEKIFYLDRLLDEVSYTGDYDEELYKSLKEQVAHLKEQRYTRQTMANSTEIDLYDEATRKVMLEVIAFAREHPQYERYPLMEELIYDIQQKDQNVLLYRMDYDDAAKAYNRFIEKHEELVKEIENKEEVEPLPLFELQSE
jgi:hypothetical protein